MRFLTEKGLCIQTETGFNVGPTHMHLDYDSPLISIFHSQWRTQALQRHPRMSATHELAYSLAVCLSEEDVLKVRALLIETVSKLRSVTDPSPSETLYQFNLDWLKI